MIAYIKNMVCVRCKMAVQAVLEELDIRYISIELGKVKFTTELNTEQLKKLDEGLKSYHLELMADRKKIVVERIKILIYQLFQNSEDEMPARFSEYLSNSLHLDYTYLANVFSETEGSSIEKFYILTKIKRVKEMLGYEDLSIKEIAFRLNYSSESHLCQQFKKVTGLTPTMYKKAFETEGVKEGVTKSCNILKE